MPLLRVIEHHEYRPEYSTFVVRDVLRPDQVRPRVGGLLAQHAVNTQPCGSFARAGDGWVEGVASGDHRHAVRIEVHDAPPDDDDLSEWDDVLETPFITSGVARLALTVDGPTGEPIEFGPPGVYRMLFARRPVAAGEDPEGSACEYLLRFWPVDAPVEPPRWLRRTGLLVDGRPASERGAFDGSYRRAITDIVMLALWAAESTTSVTLEWLADRLLTTTATVRDVIEHPVASRVLSIDGDLDDVDAPLTVTVLAKKPAEARTAPVPALPPRPGSAARQPTAARRSMPGVRGVRPTAARPMVKRQDAGAEEGRARHDGLDEPPGGDPEQAS
ncbi:MAG TPA: hypothetical protein VGD53_33915 [Actinoallomurus sp.]|jgi:hypothetical protein